MATVVPFASCYTANGHRPLQLFRKGPGGGYLCLLSQHGPRGAPGPRMSYRGPKMTLRQVCRKLRSMREYTRMQTSPVPPLVPPVVKVTEKRCFMSCFRRRRNGNIKRVA